MNRRLTSSAAIAAVALTGCSIKAEMSVMKQWDRPAERSVVEDVMRPTPPKTRIETQDPVTITPTPQKPEPSPAPQATPPAVKPMNFEAPEIIVPEKQGVIKAYYIHKHNDKGVCYVRTIAGTFAMNEEE